MREKSHGGALPVWRGSDAVPVERTRVWSVCRERAQKERYPMEHGMTTRQARSGHCVSAPCEGGERAALLRVAADLVYHRRSPFECAHPAGVCPIPFLRGTKL